MIDFQIPITFSKVGFVSILFLIYFIVKSVCKMEDDINVMLKYIVEELSREPFNYDFNAVGFATLKPEELFSAFHALLVDIDPRFKEGTDPRKPQIQKILTLLRVLRYWPKHNDEKTIRESFEIPVPETIWDIMTWLFLHKEEFKQRAYLAQFLVKMEIPDEFMMDKEVADCYQTYENKIEEFKKVHKKAQEVKSQMEKKPVSELVTDLGHINRDIDCLSKKLDNHKKRFENAEATYKEKIEQASFFRKAKETRTRLEEQRKNEEEKLNRVKKNIDLHQFLLSDLKENNHHSSPEEALERLRQDAEILRIIVKERLPNNANVLKRQINAMACVEEDPPNSRSDLEPIKLQIVSLRKEIGYLERVALARNQDPALNFARVKVGEGITKKSELVKELCEIKETLSFFKRNLENKLEIRNSKCKDIPTQEGYKEFFKQVRIKSGKYKAMKAHLQSLQIDIGHLCTTKFILEGELNTTEEDLRMVETQLGIVGFTSMQNKLEKVSNQKSDVDENKMKTIYEMATLAKQLNDKIMDQKFVLAPLMEELKIKRQEMEDREDELGRIKEQMDTEMDPILNSIEHLKVYINQLQDGYSNDQLNYVKMEAEIPVMKNHIFRAQDVSRNVGVSRTIRHYREALLAKIAESERNNSGLINETSHLDEEQTYDKGQKKMWTDFAAMLQKKICLKNEDIKYEEEDEDRDLDYLINFN